jgi:cell division protein FtsI/penicillin-binding protein 2
MDQLRPSPRRIRSVIFFMMIMAFAMAFQLVRVQFGPFAPAFAARESISEGREDEITPTRGLVFDRDGRLLASNVPTYYLEVEVRQLTDQSRKQIAAVLSRTMVLPYEDLHSQLTRDWLGEGQVRIRMTREISGGNRWPITADQVGADMLKGFLSDPLAPDLSGLSLVPAPKRTYPSHELAGHVVGFVNQKGTGFFGVEGFYDDWLTGKPITVERGSIPPEARLQPDTPTGVNLVLTIDMDVQQMVEHILEEAIETSKSETGQVIVMAPRTGEILAMASWPRLDPNHYEPWLPTKVKPGWEWILDEQPVSEETEEAEEAEDEEEDEQEGEKAEPVINPAVAAVFEPGSTYKVLTMAAALDAGVVIPEDVYIDTGVIEVGGHPIRNWDGTAWGPRTMTECMQHSLNVCLAYVASQKLEASLFYEYMKAFGIGQLTGIDLAGEVAGQLRTPRHPDWTESDLGTNSFGQGVSVTPLQLITAVAAVANEGVMVQPHVVRVIVSAEGNYWPQTTVLGHPISAKTAATLTQMLSQSLQGETNFASVAGYTLAGKTGTAQIPTEYGYDPYKTIASFIGWGPVEDPQFIVLVRLDKPGTSPWGSVVAAPVFRQIVERLVVMLGVPSNQDRERLVGGFSDG